MDGEFRDEKGEVCKPFSIRETLAIIAVFLVGALGLLTLCSVIGLWAAGKF